jgi:two-component system LytT family response regulator
MTTRGKSEASPAAAPAAARAHDGAVRVLIVDDEPLARTHLRSLLAHRDDVEVIGECGDGRSAVEAIREQKPDLVLLDIQMPELDGLGVVREVGAEKMPAVIFVTAYDEHALAAFELHALDYLLKPVNRSRFTSALDRVVGLINAEGTEVARQPVAEMARAMQAGPLERLAVKTGGRVLFLRVRDIEWIEAADDQVRIHVGRETHLHRTTLTSLEQRLPSTMFLRIHRSVLVNIDRIREFQPWFQGDWLIILGDGTKLQSGKSYRAKVREFIERQS